MKVRMIIECRGEDVGRFLGVMPASAAFTVTKIATMPKTGPMGQAIIERMKPKRRRKDRRQRDVILDLIATQGGSATTDEMTKACQAAGHMSSISGRIYELSKEGKIFRTGRGTYAISAEGVSAKGGKA